MYMLRAICERQQMDDVIFEKALIEGMPQPRNRKAMSILIHLLQPDSTSATTNRCKSGVGFEPAEDCTLFYWKS